LWYGYCTWLYSEQFKVTYDKWTSNMWNGKTGFKSIAIAAATLVMSNSAGASVFNTLDGTNYEWLELTVTQGLSRQQVEADIAAATVGDTLYGYEYASRSQVEALLLSYTSWDGVYGYHAASSVVSGMVAFMNDFGVTDGGAGEGTEIPFTSVDGYSVVYEQNNYIANYGYYGAAAECGGSDWTCTTASVTFFDTADIPVVTFQSGNGGWNASVTNPDAAPVGTGDQTYGSFLVRTAVVPVPAAVWLFASGFIGLIGIARRKK
jgi:hypothetical protein